MLNTYLCWDIVSIFDHYYLILHINQIKDGITKKSKTFRSFQVNKNLANIYLLKFKEGNTRKRCEICSKLTIKRLERRQCRRSSVFVFNLEYISHLSIMFILLTLSMYLFARNAMISKINGHTISQHCFMLVNI